MTVSVFKVPHIIPYCAGLGNILDSFHKLASFVTLKLEEHRVSLCAVNSSLSSYAVAQMDEAFFVNLNVFNKSVLNNGIRLSVAVPFYAVIWSCL